MQWTVRDYSSAVFWIIVILIAGIACAIQFTTALQESATFDEGPHLAAGYSYWKTGDFRLNVEHPPLSKLLAALPLLLLEPQFAPNAADWASSEEYLIAREFLFKNTISADTMLAASRSMTMLLSILLTISLARWVARLAGPLAGIAAAILFAFEPTVIAHSRYVTSDIPVTLFIWLSCISWYSYLEKPTRLRLLGTSVLTGLALLTKFDAPLLFVVYALTWLLRRRLLGDSGLRPFVVFGTILLSCMFLIFLAYGFHAVSISGDPALAKRIPKAYPDDGTTRSQIIHNILSVPIPGYYFFRGLHLVVRHNQSGHPTYLWGKMGTKGSWFYFPIALLVKSPVSWLALIVIAWSVAIWRAFKDRLDNHSRWQLAGLAVPVLVFFGVSLTSSINIGIRHILPVYPFLCALSAVVLFGNRVSRLGTVGVICVLIFLVESFAAYPCYVSFFNIAAGGPRNGTKYLLDSNVDWGQDLKRLKIWTDHHDVGALCLNYFGTTDPAYYSISYRPLPSIQTPEERQRLDCVAALSVYFLVGPNASSYTGLHGLKPTDIVGDSIFLFDLRHQ